jgi:glycosyltransferase involved in cell wall biosynthesis
MKILVNISNLKKGGALQVATSLLSEFRNNTEFEFHVILSSVLKKQINIESFPQNFTFYNYTIKPSTLKAITGKDKVLEKIEKTINPDCVFSVFGPSYWIPKSPHLLGYAIPHYVYPESSFFSIIGKKERLKICLLKTLHRFNFKKLKASYWVETNDVRERLSVFFNVDKSDIYVISNTYHPVFEDYVKVERNFSTVVDSDIWNNSSFKFISITSYYSHKNLEILKKVVPILRNRGIDCKFYLTLPSVDFKQFNDLSDFIFNLGPVTIDKCPDLYSQSDALFLPTLLECFTASYPEAMKMGKPIITSDLSFAHDICGDAAEYFDPHNADDIVEKIEELILNKDIREHLVEEGYKRLNEFNTAASRAKMILDICVQIQKSKDNPYE